MNSDLLIEFVSESTRLSDLTAQLDSSLRLSPKVVPARATSENFLLPLPFLLSALVTTTAPLLRSLKVYNLASQSMKLLYVRNADPPLANL